jgi:hypothetical protein
MARSKKSPAMQRFAVMIGDQIDLYDPMPVGDVKEYFIGLLRNQSDAVANGEKAQEIYLEPISNEASYEDVCIGADTWYSFNPENETPAEALAEFGIVITY